MTTTSPPSYLTVREFAEILRVNTKTVYAAIKVGTIKVVRFGHTIRIPRDQLDGFSITL